jgi:hypothetical protein
MSGTCTQGIDTGFAALGYTKVAALGVLQGITELLPISSTAHMRLVPAFLGWQDPGSAFSAATQLAALAAVVSYFWQDVRALTLNSIGAMVRGQFKTDLSVSLCGSCWRRSPSESRDYWRQSCSTPAIPRFVRSRSSVGLVLRWRSFWL